MPVNPSWAEVQGLLEGLSDGEIRELSIQALRNWYALNPSSLEFSMHGGLGLHLVPELLTRKGVESNRGATSLKEVFIEAMHQPWMTPVVEFVDWFVRAGFAFPLSSPPNTFPITLRLTRSGLTFLQRTDDHPLLPRFVDRVRARCPNLADEVTALLVDSRRCLEHGLLRPAVVLMGVAYETALEVLVESLVRKGSLQANVLDLKPALRLVRVRGVIDVVLPAGTMEERDHRFAAHAACDFADQLRRRRNDASHTTPRYGFEDRDEIEELLVSAGRHLPALWSLA